MVSATKSTPELANNPVQRRLRHPLQILRKYIRSYVAFEGIALAILFVAAWVWVGIAFDFGLFRAFGFDWLQELRDVEPTGQTGFWLRFLLLTVFGLVLVGIVVYLVVFRWLREFSDHTMAILLERRFPRQLGDRLITAVEIHDPAMAKELGFSQQMVEKTIFDAANALGKLPVNEVFNWGRLYRLWAGAVLATLGVFAFVAITSLALDAVVGGSGAIGDFLYRFRDVASIHGERHFGLMNTYWPRSAHLELSKFQPTRSNPHEMRVGRDDKRPELQVTAVEWVIADRSTLDGWRPLRWNDLPSLVDPKVLAEVKIPETWSFWHVELDEVAPLLSAAELERVAKAKTVGEFRERFTLQGSGAVLPTALAELVDWRQWPVDRIALQMEQDDVRERLRSDKIMKPLEDVLVQLNGLAAQPNMARTLRKLEIPTEVMANFRGQKTKTSVPAPKIGERKFSVPLDDLSESVRFFVRANDYYTESKRITLVPPPAFTELKADKEEPAYLYHRLQGGDQLPLKGQRQQFKDFNLSITGDTTAIDLPLGSDITLKARFDRVLVAPVKIHAPAKRDAGTTVPDEKVALDADGKGFSVRLTNLVRTNDFVFHYKDEDNVTGQRRILLRPVDDLPPEIVNFDLAVVLRKPRIKSDPNRPTQGTNLDGFLITPDARLPFEGTVRDDRGLTRVGWLYDLEQTEFELIESTQLKKPARALLGNPKTRRMGLILSGMQYTSTNPLTGVGAGPYVAWLGETLENDLKNAKPYLQDEFVPMEEFVRNLREVRSADEIPITALADKLRQAPAKQSRWEHSLKDELGFDLKKYLPSIKPSTPSEGQVHYRLKLAAGATDNNVETGVPIKMNDGKMVYGNSAKSKTPLYFLIVSESELLAQIAIEELAIFEKLGKVLEKLKNARTLVEGEVGKLQSTTDKADPSVSALRIDEVRKAVLDNGISAREIHQDYQRIAREMEVNRVQGDKINKIYDKVVFPLDDIVNPNPAQKGIVVGNFTKAEESVQKTFQLYDEEGAAGKGIVDKAGHLQNLADNRQQLDILIDRLTRIHEAMDKLVDESRLIEIAASMERLQRQNTEGIRGLHTDLTRLLLESLQGLDLK